MSKPNVVFVLADQWRADALGYAGNNQVQTPHIDRLAAQSINFTHAVAGIPVCCPARACLLTGQYALTHGVFVNDVHLGDDQWSIADGFTKGGYDTGYIGKWHVDGRGRSAYIAPWDRKGFDYWKALECTHTYNDSKYYAGDSEEQLTWEGYDAIAQTADAQAYIREHAQAEKPFFLFLSWGPPHAPYETAPERYRALYNADDIQLRPNVPAGMAAQAREWLAGYYAHCTALDDCVGDLLQTLEETGIADDTIFVFTSDHGDMLGSQGETKKQRPWDESIRIPFLLRYPHRFGRTGSQHPGLLDTVDLMPTLLSLCEVAIPESVQGLDFAPYLESGEDPSGGAALIQCIHPFGQFASVDGGRAYRGLRTGRYTYVRTLDGPWLLYDNETDPYQMTNLAGKRPYAALQRSLDARLQRMLNEREDEFLPGPVYARRWGYELDETGTVPFQW